MTRSRGRSAGALVVAALALLVGCGTTNQTGIRLGDLRTAARRVEGGGVECPLSISPALLRPSAVAADAVVLPDRSGGHGSVGTIGGSTSPGSGSGSGSGDEDVRITCAFRVGTMRVDLAVAGVAKGQAVTGLLSTMAHDAAVPTAKLIPFAARTADLRDGQAMVVPGRGSVAYAKLDAATGDVGLALAVSSLDGKTPLPDDNEITHMARTLAQSLSY